MNPVPYIDIHTHPFRKEKNTITVQNKFPEEGFAAFNGRNFYSVGLHPWHIGTKKENNNALQMIEEALELDHIIFVGETGLDKIIDNDFAEQMRVFEAQAYMAEEYQYPLVIHCVKSYDEVFELRKKMKPAMPWILHAYNGSVELSKQLEKAGFLFSFGKNLFQNNSKAINSFKYLALDKVFLETDELEWKVEEVYKQAAMHRGIEIEDLKTAIWENFNRIESSLSTRY